MTCDISRTPHLQHSRDGFDCPLTFSDIPHIINHFISWLTSQQIMSLIQMNPIKRRTILLKLGTSTVKYIQSTQRLGMINCYHHIISTSHVDMHDQPCCHMCHHRLVIYHLTMHIMSCHAVIRSNPDVR